MITVRFQIEDGPVKDSYAEWGFLPLGNGGTIHVAAPEKKRDTTSYPEQAGENTDPRTVRNVFDYSIEFLIEAPNRNLVNANSRIKAWNDAVRERITGMDVLRCKTVTLYDDRMRCKIVGIPEVIHEVGEDDFYRRHDGSSMDCVKVTLTIHVSNPELCDFDLANDKEVMPIQISLRTDGQNIFVDTSRPLTEDVEIPVLLWHGVRRNRINHTKTTYRSRFGWHVGHPFSTIAGGHVPSGTLDDESMFRVARIHGGSLLEYQPLSERIKHVAFNSAICAFRGHKSWYKLSEVRPSCRLIFGVAIYSWDGTRQKRLSNVAYFHKVSTLVDSEEGEVADVLEVP